MRTPEEVARVIQQELMCHEHTSMAGGSGCYPCGVITHDFAEHEADAIAAIVHAHADDVRADALAGFTWQHDEREWRPDNPLIPRGRNNGVKWAARRLVGPWKPDES